MRFNAEAMGVALAVLVVGLLLAFTFWRDANYDCVEWGATTTTASCVDFDAKTGNCRQWSSRTEPACSRWKRKEQADGQ